MTYARARLWLGISSVGFMVVLSLLALCFDLPGRLFARNSPLVGTAILLAAYIAISYPFDLLGGYLLPRWHNRPHSTFRLFMAAWLRGALLQALLIALCSSVILRAARLGGVAASVASAAILMLSLLLLQAPIARMVGGLRNVDGDLSLIAAELKRLGVRPPATVIYLATDPSFVGGLVGWPGRERLIIPAAWLRSLSPQAIALQIARRAGVLATGARRRGVALAFLWNLTGFAVATQLPGANPAQIAGLVATVLWFTLWSFGGLLLLPSLSRPAVFEADRFARDRGASRAILEQTISDLDRLQDDEPARAPWIERIFHPVPSVSSRLEHLQSRNTQRGAWQAARIALYLSWACCGLLSRAVHCNCGRPELWVLFPGD